MNQDMAPFFNSNLSLILLQPGGHRLQLRVAQPRQLPDRSCVVVGSVGDEAAAAGGKNGQKVFDRRRPDRSDDAAASANPG